MTDCCEACLMVGFVDATLATAFFLQGSEESLLTKFSDHSSGFHPHNNYFLAIDCNYC